MADKSEMENSEQQREDDENKQKEVEKDMNETRSEEVNTIEADEKTGNISMTIVDLENATAASADQATKDNVIVQRLREKSQKVFKKLQMARDCLQKQERDVNVSDEAARDNDLKALKALQVMRYANLSKNLPPNAATCTLNGNQNGLIATAPVRPLRDHSKNELESLVEGLQELVLKLTVGDASLKSKAELLAVNIRGLRNFPLFAYDVNNLPSTSKRPRTHSNPDALIERRASGEGIKAQENDAACRSKRCRGNKGKKKLELSPQEQLLNYINEIISERLGDLQQDKFEKLKCKPDHLANLEAYAGTLVEAGLGRIVEEEIRVNRKNNRQAFIVLSNDRDGVDAIVPIPVARRFAFEGDIVRAFVLHPETVSQKNVKSEEGIKPRKTSSNIMGGKDNSICLADDDDLFDDCDSSLDTDVDDNPETLETTAIVSDICRKAFVIKIVKETELREVVGSISFKNTTSIDSQEFYKLKPHDMKIPMVYIDATSCQDHVKATSKDDIVGMLYLARVLKTDNYGRCMGELLQPVGKVGNLEAEIKAILLHNGLKDLKPYDQKFYDLYDGPMPSLTKEDLKHRQDLRKKCVFTIDPLTARDLDDAMSVEKLSDDEYEIGVHISDVSHYLEENSELDELVKNRATSIYLVNEVIHMLPASLCYRCSLLPGEDKFAFSVFWRWDVNSRTLSEPRFTRSVINSCSQFAYEHAQKIIDNPDEHFGSDDFPEIHNGWTVDDIKWRILLLHSLSQTLRAQRYESGALSINKPKLRFTLDAVTGEPVSYEVEELQEANFLIEEFMLLANQAVAKFIHQCFPEHSILRNHSPPLEKSMRALRDRLANMDLEFNISSSKSIYESMQRLCSEASDPQAMEACLSTFLMKPMARARYYCSEGRTSEADFWHYALSIPIYTHFTSPIRRYPDILVHRLLASALNYCPPPRRTSEELHQLAKICNDQKYNAKNAGDESIDHFFVRYIRLKEAITLKAVVTDIFKYMMNVVTIETGHAFTINYKLQKVIIDTTHVPSYVLVSEKNSNMPPVKLQIFSTVNIKVVLRNNKTCAFLISPDKNQRRINSKESSKGRDKQKNNANNSNNTTNGFRNCRNSISEHADPSENINKKTRRSHKDLKDRIFAVKENN